VLRRSKHSTTEDVASKEEGGGGGEEVDCRQGQWWYGDNGVNMFGWTILCFSWCCGLVCWAKVAV